MTKKFAQFAMLIVAAFAFTSCGDSKEKVVEDTVSLMEEMADAVASGDKDKIKKLEEKGKELEKRAKALGLDTEDKKVFEDSLTEDQKKRMQAAMQKMMGEGIK